MNELTAKQLRLFNKLTPLQQEVCNGVLFKGMNQTDSYRQSRGKAKTDNAAQAGASEILSNPKVKAYMDSVMQSRLTDSIADRNEILEKLTEHMRMEPDENLDAIAVIQRSQEAIKQLRAMQGYDQAQRHEITGKVDISLDPELLARKLIFMLDNANQAIDITPEPVAAESLEQNQSGNTPKLEQIEGDQVLKAPITEGETEGN